MIWMNQEKEIQELTELEEKTLLIDQELSNDEEQRLIKESLSKDQDPVVQSFSSEEVAETETKKQRIERMYDELAKEAWYRNIEEFYVKKRWEMAFKWTLWSADEYMLKFLKSIADDLGLWGSSKEFVMQSQIPNLSSSQAVMR